MPREERFTEELKIGDMDVANVAKITQIRAVNVILDPLAATNTGDAITTVANISGVAIGDCVLPIAPVDLTDLMVSAYVQATGVVELMILNKSATASINMASGTWKFLIIRATGP